MIATFNIGGAEKQLLELASNLDKSKYEVKVIAFRDGPLREEFVKRGVTTEIVEKKWKIDPFLIPRLRKKIKQGNYDVVQSYMFTANTWGRLAAMRWFSKGRPHLIAGERSVDDWKKSIHWIFDRALASKSRAIITNATSIRKFLVETGYLPKDKIRVIPNGVDISSYTQLGDRRGKHLRPPDATVLCVGRFHPVKAQDLLLDAIADISLQLPDIRLILLGDAAIPPEEEFKTTIMEKIVRLGMTDRVSLPGFHSDIRPFLRDSDLVVLPSRREGFPNVLVESMAAGVPVVASSVGAVPEIIENEVSGIIVPPDDKSALSQAIVRVLTDHELRASLIPNGFLRANDFPVNLMVQRHEQLYEELTQDD